LEELKLSKSNESGYTLVEILIVLSLISIVGLAVYNFTISSSVNYLKLHEDGLRFSELAEKSHRMVRVFRGGGDITEATNDSVTIYAYFSPQDEYYSIIRYYKDTTKTKIMADVTPLDANPPIGNPIVSKKVTYTILSDFYDDPTKKTFQYLDSAGGVMPLPISNLHTIKGMRVTLTTASQRNPEQTKNSMTSEVSLRNRKTNL
jgi:prepilin-type N-terminal cleavage/methylation domain-containing protein